MGVLDLHDIDYGAADSLRDFVIQGRDIEKLKKRSSCFISLIEKQLPALCGKKRLLLQDIKDALESVLSGQEIIVAWRPMDAYDMDGIIYTIRRKDKPNAYIICLNQNIVDLLGDDSSKPISERKPKDAACAKAYARALKVVYLHEISHLLLNHGNMGMTPLPTSDLGRDESPMAAMCQAVYRLYSSVHEKQDFDCDLFAFVLAFWPSEEFTRLVMSVLSDWKGKDIRLMVANAFLMPINETIQWIVIRFCDRFGMHYLRREESEKKCLDSLESTSLSAFYSNGVFASEGTAAWHVANDTPHTDYKTLSITDSFLCAAFYEKKEFFCNKKADEIIVVGFNTERVREELSIINTGPVS